MASAPGVTVLGAGIDFWKTSGPLARVPSRKKPVKKRGCGRCVKCDRRRVDPYTDWYTVLYNAYIVAMYSGPDFRLQPHAGWQLRGPCELLQQRRRKSMLSQILDDDGSFIEPEANDFLPAHRDTRYHYNKCFRDHAEATTPRQTGDRRYSHMHVTPVLKERVLPVEPGFHPERWGRQKPEVQLIGAVVIMHDGTRRQLKLST
jgi:hypothetical protein